MIAPSFAAFVLILPTFTTARPNTRGRTGNGVQTSNDVRTSNGALSTPTVNRCNTGPVQCCDQVQTASSSSFASFLDFMGFAVGDPSALIGHNCSPITFFGGAGSSCDAQPVCCSNNNFNGFVALGCNPVDL